MSRAASGSSHTNLQLSLCLVSATGAHVLLNSVPEEMFQASVRCLAMHGRFLEIGNFGVSSESLLRMSVLLRNVNISGIMLESLFGDNMSAVADKQRVSQLLREGIASGVVRPLDVTMFTRERAEEAFRFMVSGKHLGKVVLQVRGHELTLPIRPNW